MRMTLPEAITYALIQRNGGMTTGQVALAINRNHWHVRKDGKPVTPAQVYAAIKRYPSQFCKAEGRVMLLI